MVQVVHLCSECVLSSSHMDSVFVLPVNLSAIIKIGMDSVVSLYTEFMYALNTNGQVEGSLFINN